MRSASAEQSTYYQDVNHSSNGARSKLPFEVSDHLARHLTLVSDPKDIVSEVELDRKRKFHLLIQRYLHSSRLNKYKLTIPLQIYQPDSIWLQKPFMYHSNML